jgi:hypothetical protein
VTCGLGAKPTGGLGDSGLSLQACEKSAEMRTQWRGVRLKTYSKCSKILRASQRGWRSPVVEAEEAAEGRHLVQFDAARVEWQVS